MCNLSKGVMEKGVAKGRAEGRAERDLEIARKLIQRGRPLEEIAEDTGLSIEEIKKLCVN